MNYKKEIRILAIILVSIIAFLFIGGYFYDNYTQSVIDFFARISIDMYGSDVQNITEPFGLFSMAMLVYLLPLYFLKETTYRSWKKFSLWYLPIVAIPLLLSSNGSHGFNPGVGMDTESLTFFFSGVYAFISLILIVYKSIKLRGK